MDNDDDYDEDNVSKFYRYRPPRFNIFDDDSSPVISNSATLIKNKTKDTFNNNNNSNKSDDSYSLELPQISTVTATATTTATNSNLQRGSIREKKETSNVAFSEQAVTPKVERANERASEIAARTLEAQKKAEKIFYEDEEKPDPVETIKKIMNNRYFKLEEFKALSMKEKLLDEAIKKADGNAILAIVLFLKRSLNTDKFYEFLNEREEAFNHYVYYLTGLFSTHHHELESVYRQNKKFTEATAVQYVSILDSLRFGKLKEKIKALKDIREPSDAFKPMIQNQLNMYEFFEQIREAFPSKEAELLAIDNAADALSFYFTNFNVLRKNFPEEKVKKHFKLDDRQYSIYFIRTMAEKKLYYELDYFIKESTFFSRKEIPFETISDILHTVKTPVDEIRKYVKQIEKEDSKLDCARKYKCHDIVIDILKSRKDKAQLGQYLSILPVDSPDRKRAQEIYNDLNKK